MKKTNIITTVLILILSSFAFCYADEEPVYIYTAEDMLKLAEDPSNTFQLMADIDMSGIDWKPGVFSGVFLGNGHTIYNFNSTQLTDEVRVTYDGNKLAKGTHYDETRFGGLFGILENARVEDLTLLAVNIELEAGESCAFAGPIAGIVYDSIIENCTAEGCVSLTTSGHNFGVGGFVGCAEKGSIESCTNNMTLICIDTDKEYKDEQFMGGAYSHGYMNVENCTINIEGFDSDHGYVHDGGIVGMFFQYDSDHFCSMSHNTVNGTIHFFEDNKNRRAYCSEYIGEIMTWNFKWDGNVNSFVRDETKDYSRDLFPHMDCSGEMKAVVTEPDYENLGYTEYTCESCGEGYIADYRLPLKRAEKAKLTVSLNETVIPGEHVKMSWDIEPADSVPESVEFFSSDENVLTVDQEGDIITVAPGTASVSIKIDGKVMDSVSITVSEPPAEEEPEPEKTNSSEPLIIIMTAVGTIVFTALVLICISLIKRRK